MCHTWCWHWHVYVLPILIHSACFVTAGMRSAQSWQIMQTIRAVPSFQFCINGKKVEQFASRDKTNVGLAIDKFVPGAVSLQALLWALLYSCCWVLHSGKCATLYKADLLPRCWILCLMIRGATFCTMIFGQLHQCNTSSHSQQLDMLDACAQSAQWIRWLQAWLHYSSLQPVHKMVLPHLLLWALPAHSRSMDQVPWSTTGPCYT